MREAILFNVWNSPAVSVKEKLGKRPWQIFERLLKDT